jgi:DNA-directed RNA polymerase specialized sigma24 family protein
MWRFRARFWAIRADTPLARMERTLKRLDSTTRGVFLLHRLHSLAYAEIAEQLGISMEEVEARIASAMLRLADAVSDTTPDG